MNKALLLFLALSPMVIGKSRKLARLQSQPLSRTRCDLMCSDVNKDEKVQCRTKCRNEELRPGTCQSEDSPNWAKACVQACSVDFQCDGVQKCCHHGCGSTCSEPIDLLTLSGLPALPVMEEPKEKKRSVVVKWTDGVGDLARAVPGRVLYILQQQSHMGPKFDEPQLGEWELLLRTNKTRVALKNMKPGRWYRFRVAAISSEGTRGYSEPSPPFTPRKGPRPPPAPKRLRVHPLKSDNGTVTIRLDWKEPKSDLPLMRYKVFWSRRVRGVDGELDSVLVNHQTVPKEQKSVDIKDLQPNSMYFLQVQSISQFGPSKLRSDKAAVFFNTTNGSFTSTKVDRKSENLEREKKVSGLRLHNVIWYNRKLKARISWDPLPKVDGKPRRYYVHWKTVKCDNPQRQNKDLSATTEQTGFEIYELDHRCTYLVHVNKSWKPKRPDSELTVVVPGCEYFQQKMNGARLNCET